MWRGNHSSTDPRNPQITEHRLFYQLGDKARGSLSVDHCPCYAPSVQCTTRSMHHPFNEPSVHFKAIIIQFTARSIRCPCDCKLYFYRANTHAHTHTITHSFALTHSLTHGLTHSHSCAKVIHVSLCASLRDTRGSKWVRVWVWVTVRVWVRHDTRESKWVRVWV